MKTIFIGLGLLVSVRLNAQTLPYLDDQFSCIEKEQAETFMDDFKIKAKSFGGVELCDPNSDFKRLANDLKIIKEGRFSSVSRDNVYIRNLVKGSYYTWLKSMTRGMERGNDIPFATAYNRGGHFTMQNGWARLSTLGRVGTVLHEGRHTAGYTHIPCTHGPYAGSTTPGCDRDYGYGGSHAVEMEYYARVAVLGENFHPVYKTMARLMAVARSNFVFNTSPIQSKKGLVLVEKDTQRILLLDQGNLIEREHPGIRGALKRTSYGAALFDGQKAYAVEMYERSGFNPTLTDTYSYFKLLLDLKLHLKDFEEYDQNSRRYSVALSENNQLTSYDYPRGEWKRPLALNFQPIRSVTTLSDGSEGYFLVDDKDEIYALDQQRYQFVATAQKWNLEDVQIVNYTSKNLILKNNGLIYTKNSEGQLSLWEAQLNPMENMVTVPLYDGFEIVS